MNLRCWSWLEPLFQLGVWGELHATTSTHPPSTITSPTTSVWSPPSGSTGSHPPRAPRNLHPPPTPAPQHPHPPPAPHDPHPPHSPMVHTPPSHPPPHVRALFRQLYPFNASVGQSGRKSRSAAYGLLTSSAINKKKLVPPKIIIQNNQKLMY